MKHFAANKTFPSDTSAQLAAVWENSTNASVGGKNSNSNWNSKQEASAVAAGSAHDTSIEGYTPRVARTYIHTYT